jgi:hypothetical protein
MPVDAVMLVDAVISDDAPTPASLAASEGFEKSSVGSAVAEHDATNAETIATERMRHSAVAIRDRCFGNPVPLPVSEPARRWHGALGLFRRPCPRTGKPELTIPQHQRNNRAMDEMRRHNDQPSFRQLLPLRQLLMV